MKGQTDLKVCPFFPFSRGWSRTSAPQPSPLLQKNHETTFTPPPAPPKPALGSLCHQGQSPAGRGKPARRHLPACRARGKPESAHHSPIKLHDRAGGAADTACREAPKKPAARRAQPAAKCQKPTAQRAQPAAKRPKATAAKLCTFVNSHLDFTQIFRIFAFAKEGNRRSGCPPAFYKAGSGGIWRRDGQN